MQRHATLVALLEVFLLLVDRDAKMKKIPLHNIYHKTLCFKSNATIDSSLGFVHVREHNQIHGPEFSLNVLAALRSAMV